MTKPDLFLTYELMSSIAQTDTWETVKAEDPAILEAEENFFHQVNQLPGHMRMPGRYSDRLQGAVWELVNAYVQAATLYGYHVAQVLQGAGRRPQELSAYMRETEAGGVAV